MVDIFEAAHDKNNATIHNLVEWFILKENMSQKKVQKLCYYAQAWSLALTSHPIIEGMTFEAWVHGPVNPEIYKMLKNFGWQDIEIKDDYVDESIEEINERFSKKDIEVLESVWDTYGHLSADELEMLTHNETPWLEKRSGLSRFQKSQAEISEDTMKEYYRSISLPGVI